MATRTYTVGQNSGARRLDDLTGSWVDIPLNLNDLNLGQPIDDILLDVMTDPNDPDKVFAVGGRVSSKFRWPGIYYSTDAGATWNMPSGGSILTDNYRSSRNHEVWCIDSNNIVVAGDSGFCYKSTDGGLTFNTFPTPPTISQTNGNPEFSAWAIHFITPLAGVIYTGEGGAYYCAKTTDGGLTWTFTSLNLAGGNRGRGIHMSSNGQVITALCDNAILRSTDGGATFTNVQQITGSPAGKAGIHLTWTDDNNLWAYCTGSQRFRSTDGGVTWTEINPFSGDPNLFRQFGGHHYALPSGFFSENLDILSTSDESLTGTLSETSPYAVAAVWTHFDDPGCPCFVAENCDDETEQILVTQADCETPIVIGQVYEFAEHPDKCWTIVEEGNCNVETVSLNTGTINENGTVGVQDDTDYKWIVTQDPLCDTPAVCNAVPKPATLANQTWFSGYGTIPNAAWITLDPGQVNQAGGNSTYELQFNTPIGFVPNLDLQLLTDNTGLVYLNGNLIADTSSTPNAWVTPTLVNVSNPAFFNVGANTLTVVINNVGTGSNGFALAGSISNTNPPAETITITATHVDCDTCAGLPCFRLTNCATQDVIYISGLETVLTDYIGSVVELEADPENFCFLVEQTVDDCPDVYDVLPGTIIECHTTCERCLPEPPAPPEPFSIKLRTVKPGYDTPGCSPEYHDKVNCRYAESLYQEMASVRFGIEFCCENAIDQDKWAIKKDLLDLKMITDPEACTTPECCNPCSTEGDLLVVRSTTPTPVACSLWQLNIAPKGIGSYSYTTCTGEFVEVIDVDEAEGGFEPFAACVQDGTLVTTGDIFALSLGDCCSEFTFIVNPPIGDGVSSGLVEFTTCEGEFISLPLGPVSPGQAPIISDAYCIDLTQPVNLTGEAQDNTGPEPCS